MVALLFFPFLTSFFFFFDYLKAGELQKCDHLPLSKLLIRKECFKLHLSMQQEVHLISLAKLSAKNQDLYSIRQ